MRSVFSVFLLLGVLDVAGTATTARAVIPEALEGIWQGTLSVQGGAIELRLVFKVQRDEDGDLEAFLDSPDQGAANIPVNKVILEDGQVEFHVISVAGHYQGTLDETGNRMEGHWFQSARSLPLVLERGGEPVETKRPQEPDQPLPYRSEEVEYRNESGGVSLSGTLTWPDSGGPSPCVILISGSGPQDRDESVFGHRPFLVLADHLTRQGIAVLRVDDRGVGGSTGDIAEATTEDFAADVLAGIEYLKGRPEIDSGSIGLIGHSEGGLIAPLVASRTDAVAFLVLLAAPAFPGEEILYDQSAMLGRVMGADEDRIEQNRKIQETMFDVLKSDLTEEEMRRELREALTAAGEDLSEEERAAAGLDSEAAIDAQLNQVMNPWFRFFLTYDPRPALREVDCPVLAITGSKDLQVPAGKNLEEMEATLRAGGNTRVTAEEIPGLNHLFQTAETGAVTEYGRIEETFAPIALERISDWILEQVP